MNIFWALLRALLSLIVLLALVVGLPFALVYFVGWPWVVDLPSATDFGDMIAGRVPVPGDLLADGLALVMWILWIQVVWALVVETMAALRGRLSRRVPVLPGIQLFAAKLITALTLLTSSFGMKAAAAGPLLPVVPASGIEAPSVASPAQAPNLGYSVQNRSMTAPAPAMGQSTSASVTQHRATAAASANAVYTTAPGDTLWGLSEQLFGSGTRWKELRDLNLGRAMPDGSIISNETELLGTDWPILVPAEAGTRLTAAGPGANAGVGTERNRAVTGGDTLWAMAEENLRTAGEDPSPGSVADRVDEIVSLNQIDDPDLIQPGQRIVLPPVSPRAEPPKDQTASSPSTASGSSELLSPSSLSSPSETSTSEASSPSELSSPMVEPSPPTPPRRAGEVSQEQPVMAPGEDELYAMGTGGPGLDESSRNWRNMTVGIAAIALVGSYLYRANRSRRAAALQRRRPRHRPSPVVENHRAPSRRLSAAAEPQSHDLLQTGVRALSRVLEPVKPQSLPRFLGAWVGQDSLVFVLDPHGSSLGAPRPFIDLEDRTGWLLRRADVVEAADLACGANGPLPLLATLGALPKGGSHGRAMAGRPEVFSDDPTAVFTVDLEPARVVSVNGEASDVVSAMAAMAMELATTPMADQVEIICVGFGHRLQTFDRVRVVDRLAEVVPELEEVTDRAELNHGVAGPFATRVGNGAADAWNPLVVFSANPDDPDVAYLLDLARTVEGGVTVVCGFDTAIDWTLRVTSESIMAVDLPGQLGSSVFVRPQLDEAVVMDVLDSAWDEVEIDDEFWDAEAYDAHWPADLRAVESTDLPPAEPVRLRTVEPADSWSDHQFDLRPTDEDDQPPVWRPMEPVQLDRPPSIVQPAIAEDHGMSTRSQPAAETPEPEVSRSYEPPRVFPAPESARLRLSIETSGVADEPSYERQQFEQEQFEQQQWDNDDFDSTEPQEWSAPPWSMAARVDQEVDAEVRHTDRPARTSRQPLVERVTEPAGEPIRVTVLDSFTIGGHLIGDRTKPWKYSKTPELILYLLLHPAGAGQDVLMEALFPEQPPNRPRLNQLMSDARTKALGLDTTGDYHLPHAAASDPHYRLNPTVDFDLRDFARFCARARQATDESVAIGSWREALKLVADRPFAVPHDGYDWALPEIEATIVKVEEAAVALADLALDRGDYALAVWATKKGLLTGTGYYELLERRGRAALAYGDPEEIVRAFSDLQIGLEWSDSPESHGPDPSEHPGLAEVYGELASAGRGTGGRR